MKNKKVLQIILAIIVIIAAVVVIVLAVKSGSNEKPTEATESVSVETTVPATSPTAGATQIQSTTKNAEPSVAELPKAIQGKYWYLYDDDKLTVYAFEFDKNNQVNLAYFGSETIKGLDAEYTKGYSVYSYSDGKVTIKDLPDEFPISSFTFDIKNNKVYNGKTELEEMDDLSLDNALRHFV